MHLGEAKQTHKHTHTDTPSIDGKLQEGDSPVEGRVEASRDVTTVHPLQDVLNFQ